MTTTSANYQHMTSLPEALERGLLDVPAAALIKRLRKEKEHRSLIGASDKYTLVQFMARAVSEAEVEKFLAADHAGEPDELSIAEAPAPLLRRRTVTPVAEGHVIPNVPKAEAGLTTGGLPGSAVKVKPVAGADVSGLDETRSTVLAIIQKADGACISVGDIRKAYGKPAAASVAKLLDLGVVELCE
jgi:hypothetical protein